MGWLDDTKLSDVLSSPGAMVGLPLALGFLAGATPGTARAAHGLTAGLGLVGQAQQQQEADRRRRKLQEALSGVFTGTTGVTTPAATLPAATTSLGLASEEAGNIGAATLPEPSTIAPETTRQVPVYSPQVQKLGPLLTEADPEAAAKLLIGLATREPQKPVSVRPGGALVSPTGEELYKAESAPRLPRALNPIEEENIRSQIAAREREKQPTPLLPIQEENIRSQMASRASENALRGQRLTNLRNAANIAKDPKATLGQLSASLNALVRERDSFETPEEEKPQIQEAIRAIRGRLGQVGAGISTEGLGGQPMDKMPDPKTAKGRTLRDTQTGQRFRSDGTRWIPLEGGGEY